MNKITKPFNLMLLGWYPYEEAHVCNGIEIHGDQVSEFIHSIVDSTWTVGNKSTLVFGSLDEEYSENKLYVTYWDNVLYIGTDIYFNRKDTSFRPMKAEYLPR